MAGSFEFKADPITNRLYIRLSGFFRGRDVDPAMDELSRVLGELRPGFDTITDLSDFVPGAPGASKALTEGGEKIKAAGRRRGVRVTGGLMTGLMQFQRMLKGVFEEDDTRYAKSLREAEELLDNWPTGGGD
jgi:hypothetical protein